MRNPYERSPVADGRWKTNRDNTTRLRSNGRAPPATRPAQLAAAAEAAEVGNALLCGRVAAQQGVLQGYSGSGLRQHLVDVADDRANVLTEQLESADHGKRDESAGHGVFDRCQPLFVMEEVQDTLFHVLHLKVVFPF
jgi:hypothetical protein